jgi:hypothetical protein
MAAFRAGIRDRSPRYAGAENWTELIAMDKIAGPEPTSAGVARTGAESRVERDSPAPGRRHFSYNLVRGFGASLREHTLVIAVVLLHLGVGLALPFLLGRDLHFAIGLATIAESVATLSFWMLLLAVLIGFAAAGLRRRHKRPLLSAWRWLIEDFGRSDRIWGGMLVMLLFPVFVWNFTFIEALIPILHPFRWDATFAEWDRWLHFGRQPWEWLQPLLGYPAVTSFLSAAYAAWFFVLYGVTVMVAFLRRDPVIRMQYLLCSMLIWMVVGNLLGTVFSSAGPEYFGRVTGLADPFQPLMDYLRAADAVWPIYTVHLQEKMWQLYLINGEGGLINGNVTAMPSLHVATAFSFFLVSRAMSRVLGWALGIFAAIILVATVHLGWHYAIDGYAAIVLTAAIWWGCGRLLRWPVMRRVLWGETHRPAVAPPPGVDAMAPASRKA